MQEFLAASPPSTLEDEQRFFEEPVRYSSADNLVSLLPEPPRRALSVGRLLAAKVLFGAVVLAVLALLAVEGVTLIRDTPHAGPAFDDHD